MATTFIWRPERGTNAHAMERGSECRFSRLASQAVQPVIMIDLGMSVNVEAQQAIRRRC